MRFIRENVLRCVLRHSLKIQNSQSTLSFAFVRFQRLWHSFERKKIADSSSAPFRCRPGPGPQHPAGAGRGAPDVAATLGHQGSLSVNSTDADFNFKALRLETGCDKNEIAGIERFFLFSLKKLVLWIGSFFPISIRSTIKVEIYEAP